MLMINVSWIVFKDVYGLHVRGGSGLITFLETCKDWVCTMNVNEVSFSLFKAQCICLVVVETVYI